MYKKLYKEANDAIPLNTELLGKLNLAAKEDKKKKNYSQFYRYGALAAAVVIVIGVMAFISKDKNTLEESSDMSNNVNIISRTAEEEIKDKSIGKDEVLGSPGVGEGYEAWVLPAGVEFIGQAGNVYEFSDGNMNIKVEKLQSGTIGDDDMKKGDEIIEGCVMEEIKPSNYKVYLRGEENDYIILAENLIIEEIKDLVKSIK